jgi:hypothetical protein
MNERQPGSPQELHDLEDREANWQDKDSWDTTEYAYQVGWDISFQYTDEDIENLERYSG